ncbi:hypothetical protein [Vitiosangium sp. GDMCC 1.1324]|uniref:hypothetical protein n=1 Tax=Vitiosangium sp. (strain GDMCC 1.1324) TaxID=2138576 RepID=UPI00130D5277|nr:hypothetical protein [Vitiosangium sp. GDMCC 1.1324]
MSVRVLTWTLAVFLLIHPQAASAFPWMIKHNYTSCQSCHVDPSGGGVMTDYGRAQQQTLLETQWGTPNLEGEASPNTQFLYGALGSSRPEWFLPELSVRAGGLFSRSVNLGASSNEGQVRDVLVPVVMAADVRAAVVAGAFRAMASLGVAPRRAFAASLTPVGDVDGTKLISRDYWLGAALLDDALFIRAGRLTLPFGIRSVEHTLWARAVTRTDFNDSQQHGVAVAYSGESFRTEVMAIAGNFQVSPDDYRERGASGYFEYVFAPNLTAGVSSLVTFARYDRLRSEANTLRQAHGLFARYAPSPDLALVAELDALVRSSQQGGLQAGVVGYAQADLEVVRGLHLLGTVELLREDQRGAAGTQLGGWLGMSWFVTRGLEVRLDGFARQTPVQGQPSISNLGGVLLLHLYL